MVYSATYLGLFRSYCQALAKNSYVKK